MAHKVTTIIPTTRGGLTYITRLLPKLITEPTEIVVIDNSSRDGTTNYLSSNFDCVIKVNNPGRNFSQSNNQGANLSGTEYLLFLNNDTWNQKGFIQKMISTFDIDPNIAVVGCRIYTMDNPKRVQHAGVMFNQEYVPYELGLSIMDGLPELKPNDTRVTSIREVPSVTACCMMVKKSVFEEVGGFDEQYITGWEDTDLVLRIRELGYKVWYNGEAIIYHQKFGSRSAGRFTYEEQNRKRYDDIWVHTGRAKKIVGDKREL